jgi:ABC-type multidrug transport system fused ATPase/permease subunit
VSNLLTHFWVIAVSLAAIADAGNATERLTGVFEAEILDDTYIIDESIDNAVEVKNASFTWDAPLPDASDSDKDQDGKKKSGTSNFRANRRASKLEADDATEGPTKQEDHVFQLKDVSLTIPRGQLVAIVGAVGSGKSSLLQGLIGEMRRTTGNVAFGGSVGYCPQIPWIQVTHSKFAKVQPRI